MMISPETYYETTIKGKTPEEILKEIETLKADIAHQKEVMKDPFSEEALRMPSPSTIIKVERQYLKAAKEAYQKLVGDLPRALYLRIPVLIRTKSPENVSKSPQKKAR